MLDRRDPFDRILVEYREAIDNDALPTIAQQRVMVAGVQNDRSGSRWALIENHKGLIAAVAYPFKRGVLPPEELICEGARALVGAAETYVNGGPVDFSDHAAAAIHDRLRGLMPELAGDSFMELPELPMESVYRFMESVRVPKGPEDLEHMEARYAEREARKLNPEELEVVPLLDLTARQISEATGKSFRTTQKRVASIKDKLGAKTIEGTVLRAMERGVEYPVLDMDPDDFTVDERRLAMRLDRPNKALMRSLDFGKNKIETLMASLYAKTGAGTRAQILVAARKHRIEPTKGERKPKPSPLIERLTPEQTRLIGLAVHMTYPEIAELPDIDMDADRVGHVIGSVIRAADLTHNNKTALFVELQRQGMEFDVPEPERPLSDLLFAHELDIAALLHLPNKEIIKSEAAVGFLGEDADPERINDIVADASRKVGARSRSELALMVAMYYDGSQALELDRSNNRWRLAQHLGLKTIQISMFRRLLSATTDKQRRAIEAYYPEEGAPTWEEAAASIDMKAAAAQKLVSRGILRMLEELEREREALGHTD